MSSCGAHSVAFEPPVLESEQSVFFRLLLHDDRDSFYIVSTDASGAWTDTAMKAAALENFSPNMVSNYYVTHNGFTGKRRLSTRTRQLTALFFDMDCHGVPVSECEKLVKDIVGRLDNAVKTGVLPRPTMIIDSGRGLHLYLVLDRSIPYRFRGDGQVNEAGISFFNHVQLQLADVLDEVLDGLEGVKVDRAVFDATRVSRIPGTYNTKAGRRARLLASCEAFYSLSELNAYKPAAAVAKAAKAPKKSSNSAVILKYDRLMLSRLNKVAELQEYRQFNCEGSRELMCFVYYNTAVQVYSKEDAWSRLVSFNERFLKPIALSELKGIEEAVSQVRNIKGQTGCYVLNASSIIRLLGLTEKEMEDTHFFASKRMVERLEAKRKTQEKRSKRNERIVELYETGTMTQKQVAEEIGCSERTVYAVLKAAADARKAPVVASAGRKPRARVSLRDVAKKVLSAASKSTEKTARFSADPEKGFSFGSKVRKILANVSLSSDLGEAAQGLEQRLVCSEACDNLASSPPLLGFG